MAPEKLVLVDKTREMDESWRSDSEKLVAAQKEIERLKREAIRLQSELND